MATQGISNTKKNSRRRRQLARSWQLCFGIQKTLPENLSKKLILPHENARQHFANMPLTTI
jgi:hypothetical protein